MAHPWLLTSRDSTAAVRIREPSLGALAGAVHMFCFFRPRPRVTLAVYPPSACLLSSVLSVSIYWLSSPYHPLSPLIPPSSLHHDIHPLLHCIAVASRVCSLQYASPPRVPTQAFTSLVKVCLVVYCSHTSFVCLLSVPLSAFALLYRCIASPNYDPRDSGHHVDGVVADLCP